MKETLADRFRAEILVKALSGGLGIVLGYAFLSRAFSTGSYWQYFFAIFFAVLGIKLLSRVVKKYYERKAR